jgi:hypothetical protein
MRTMDLLPVSLSAACLMAFLVNGTARIPVGASLRLPFRMPFFTPNANLSSAEPSSKQIITRLLYRQRRLPQPLTQSSIAADQLRACQLPMRVCIHASDTCVHFQVQIKNSHA